MIKENVFTIFNNLGNRGLIRFFKCFLNTEVCNVQDLYSLSGTHQSHETNSRNVNNRRDRCLADDRIHTEFQHFLVESYFGILAQIKCIIQ